MPVKKKASKRTVKRKVAAKKKKPAKKGPMFVVQTLKGDWIVKKQGKKTPEGKFTSKPRAVVAATRMAKRTKGSLKIKAKTGKIQAMRSFA